jgi:hypothetical protein
MMSNNGLRRSLMLIAVLVLFGTMSGPALAARPVESDEVTTNGLPCFLPLDLRAPYVERWIELSLRDQVVRLCECERVMGEYLAATGRGDRPETTTFKGLFTVYEKNQGPLYLREYGVFIRDWVGFDQDHDNGFHSQPMDANGLVLDSRLGQSVSQGCVRTAQSAEVFRFAKFGMQVWVH